MRKIIRERSRRRRPEEAEWDNKARDVLRRFYCLNHEQREHVEHVAAALRRVDAEARAEVYEEWDAESAKIV